MTLRLLFVLVLAAVTCSGQVSTGYTQRGFLENQGTVYPAKAPNDSGHVIGEAPLQYEGVYRASASLQFGGGLYFRIDTHRQVERESRISWWDRETERPSG